MRIPIGRGRSRTKSLLLLGLPLYVALVVVALSPASHVFADGTEDTDDPSALVTPEVAPDMDVQTPAEPANVELPTLSTDQQARIRDLVASSAPIAAALQGTSYTVADVIPWDTANSPEQLIGGVVTLSLASPVALDNVALPSALFDSSDSDLSPYKTTTLQYTAPAVSKLMVEVDLNRDKVVDVEPDLGTPDVSSKILPGAPDPDVPDSEPGD